MNLLLDETREAAFAQRDADRIAAQETKRLKEEAEAAKQTASEIKLLNHLRGKHPTA